MSALLLTVLGAGACSQEPAKAPDDGAYLATETPEPRPDPAMAKPDPGPMPQERADATAPSGNAVANTPASPAPASDTPAAPQPGVAADNTKKNERDRSSAALTPMDQGNGEADLKITQKIRQAVTGNDALSFTAKNVKIITANGKVTLRGPVKTDAERAAIESAAKNVAGAGQVDNQIEVKK